MNFAVLEKLELEFAPVGVKYGFFPPEGIAPLEEGSAMSLCELLREAQRREEPFYFSRANTETCVGKNILGMETWAAFAKSGQIGEKLGVFNDARCNGRLYQYVQHLEEGTVNYVSFAHCDRMNFAPDLLIFAAPPAKAECILRAATYSTGELYTSVCTPTIGCSWLFAYPYREDKINFVIPALVHGLHGRQLYPEDTMLISVPYRWIPTVLSGLEEMELRLKGHEGLAQYHEEFEGIVRELEEKQNVMLEGRKVK